MIGTGGELPGSGTEDTQIADFINRRFQEAFDTSPVWPRYLVSSEERKIIAVQVSGAGGTDASLINGDYQLLRTHNGASLAVNGSNLYLGDISGSSVDGTVVTGAVGYERLSDGAWVFATGASITSNADGTKTLTGAGTVRFLEIDDPQKSFPFEVETFQAQTGVGSSGTLVVTPRQFIPYAQTGQDTIGDFNRIHRKKAFLNNSAIEYDFFADADGANILNITNTTDNTAFVTYKKQFTPFSVTTDFYNSTAEVPAEFFNYIAHTVYADFLRVQNKQEEAIAEENVGAKYLAQELEKVDIRMNNSTINKRFSTYVSRQSR